MIEFLEMMAAPAAAALVLAAMHCYLGYHVVKRGVIFVDIAMAQLAAFGVAVSLLFGLEMGGLVTHAVALGGSLLGALLIAGTRSRNGSVPQEAYIGIIYVVFSAAMILALTRIPHGGEEIRHLLVGAILWVTWPTVLTIALYYGLLGVLLYLWRRPMTRISLDPDGAIREGTSLRGWDFAFYAVLGAVVTYSVQIAGVLLVFTMLVVPAVMALRLFDGTRAFFAHAVGVSLLAVVLGSTASYLLDLPRGASIVCAFGILLVLQVLLESLFRGD